MGSLGSVALGDYGSAPADSSVFFLEVGESSSLPLPLTLGRPQQFAWPVERDVLG